MIKEEIQERMQSECREEDLLDSEKVDSLARDYAAKVEKSFREHSVYERNVSVLLNLRVSQVVPSFKMDKKRSAVVSLWRPTEETKDLLSPGRIFRAFNLIAKPTAGRPADMIQLDGTKGTEWVPMGNMSEQNGSSLCFEMNDFSCDSIESLRSKNQGHEFDFSGVVIKSQELDNCQYSVFMVSQSQLAAEETPAASAAWLLRVAVDCECTGLGNLRQSRAPQVLSFQNLSLDFVDEANSIVSCKAGIQSICSRKMVRSSAGETMAMEMTHLLRRVSSLTEGVV